MEILTAALGAVGALPQMIQSAKQLYDLRARYKDATILITAIYSESLVISAALSQVQSLLQHDALQRKPQLLETFDRALTGCTVVYGCLEEEVRDLAAKTDNDDLRFKDRAKFLWNEETFRELLTQIRGQQSALSLLIQGLQMESIADIKILVEENSVMLDQVVRRSRTLRQSHPRVKVPESVFSYESNQNRTADEVSVKSPAEFAFDSEVANSKVYQRAMADDVHPVGEAALELEGIVLEDESTVFEASSVTESSNSRAESEGLPLTSEGESLDCTQSKSDRKSPYQVQVTGEHQDLFDTLERDILSFMPCNTYTPPHLYPPKIESKLVEIVHSPYQDDRVC